MRWVKYGAIAGKNLINEECNDEQDAMDETREKHNIKSQRAIERMWMFEDASTPT